MKLYEQELRMILDECVMWGNKNKVSNTIDSSVASNGKVIKMKSNSIANLPKQQIVDCVGYLPQNTAYMILKMSREFSFVIYMRDIITERCERHKKYYGCPNYSLVIDNFHVDDYMKRFKLTKSTAYNYICRCEKMGFIYDEGNSRYSLSFIFNPFEDKEEVVKQNESFAIRYYSSTSEGELFISKKYGSFDKSPWSRHMMIGSEVYTLSEKSSSVPTAILRWLDEKMKDNGCNSFYIDYRSIAVLYSNKYSSISDSKVRRFVKIMESDGVIKKTGILDNKRICYTIDYNKIEK